jgi:hypothetical protein
MSVLFATATLLASAVAVEGHQPPECEQPQTPVPACSPNQVKHWNRIWREALGVEGHDPHAFDLGSPPKSPPPATDGLHEWPLIHPRKERYCGGLHHAGVFQPVGGFLRLFGVDEKDLTVNILPAPAYDWILKSAQAQYPEAILDACPDQEHPCIHAEVTPNDRFKRDRDDWQRWLGPFAQESLPPEQRTELCVYGPLVVDSGHDHHAEVHPIQLMWMPWKRVADNRPMMLLFLLQDASNRFTELKHFLHDQRPPRETWHPWAEPPLNAEFRVAFRAREGAGATVWLDQLSGREVRRAQTAKNWCGGTEGPLVCSLGDPPHLTVQVSEKAAPNIRLCFEDVCRGTDDRLQGFIKIQTAAGRPGCGREGVQLLTLSEEPPGPEGVTAAAAFAETRLFRAEARVATGPELAPGPPPPPAPPPPVDVATQPSSPARAGGATKVRLLVAVKEEHAKDPEVLSGQAAHTAWGQLLEAAKAPSTNLSRPADVQVLRARQWEIEFGPHYAGSQEAGEIQQALGTGDFKRVTRLLHPGKPYRVTPTWPSVKASTTDGGELAVRFVRAGERKGGQSGGEVIIEELSARESRARVRVSLPEGPPGVVYRLDFECALRDEAGYQGTTEHSVLSHGLDVKDANTARLLLYGLSPSVRGARDDPGPAGVQALQLSMAAERLVDKEIVTLSDLEGLVATAELIGDVPRE